MSDISERREEGNTPIKIGVLTRGLKNRQINNAKTDYNTFTKTRSEFLLGHEVRPKIANISHQWKQRYGILSRLFLCRGMYIGHQAFMTPRIDNTLSWVKMGGNIYSKPTAGWD